MAGNGPPPAENRRRRNEPARGDWIDLPPLKRIVLPPLPRRGKKEGTWSSRTRAMYEGWRRDPVTATYGKNEIAAVAELAYLQELLSRGKLSLAGEIRQRADGLGLTLKGKRDLRYRVVDAEPEAEATATRRSPKRNDRRARLELVKT